jgi:hypothetical protein
LKGKLFHIESTGKTQTNTPYFLPLGKVTRTIGCEKETAAARKILLAAPRAIIRRFPGIPAVAPALERGIGGSEAPSIPITPRLEGDEECDYLLFTGIRSPKPVFGVGHMLEAPRRRFSHRGLISVISGVRICQIKV